MHDEFNVATLAYCLLGNHFHLLLRCEDRMLSLAMHQAMSTYARQTNIRVGRDGPLFRGRFQSFGVDTDRYLLTATRYIHRNALDVAPHKPLADYRWSSLGAYLGRRAVPSFLDTEFVMAVFGSSSASFAEFHEVDLKSSCSGSLSPGDLRSLVRSTIVAAVACGAVNDEDVRGLQRTVLVALLDAPLSAADRVAVEEVLGPIADGAARVARLRARRRMESEPAVKSIFTQVLGTIAPNALAPAA